MGGRGRGGVGALDDAADAAARKIADREARDWEWQSSWQWEWQQELDVETRGARRAMEPPAPAQSPAKVHPSPEKRPAVTTFERRTSSATSTPTKAAAAAATTTPVRTPPGARSAAKPPRSPAFVGSPASTAGARRSPFKEPIAAAPVAVSTSAPAAVSTSAPAAASPEPEPKVKFGRRARGGGEGVEASRDPPTVPPSPPMPSPPTLTERSPQTERPGASSSSSSYAERREAYRESRADRALSPFVAPAESVGGGDGGRARPSVPTRRTAFDSDDSDVDVGEDVETLPDELSVVGRGGLGHRGCRAGGDRAARGGGRGRGGDVETGELKVRLRDDAGRADLGSSTRSLLLFQTSKGEHHLGLSVYFLHSFLADPPQSLH